MATGAGALKSTLGIRGFLRSRAAAISRRSSASFRTRIPQHADHVAGRHETDASLAVAVGPDRLRRIAAPARLIGVLQPILIHASGQHVLRVLVIGHIVLLVGNHEIVNAPGNRMVPIDDLHLERPDGRMAGVDRAFDLPVVLVHQRRLAVVVKRPQGSAFFDPLPDPLALLGRHPADPPFSNLLLDGWNAHHIVLPLVPVNLVPVAVGKAQSIPEHDEDLVMTQMVISEQLFLVGEIDGQARVLHQGAGQRRADVVRVMRLIATQRKGCGPGRAGRKPQPGAPDGPDERASCDPSFERHGHNISHRGNVILCEKFYLYFAA